jgi:hypothetical protein
MKSADLGEPPMTRPLAVTGKRRHWRRWVTLPIIALLALVLTDRILLVVVEHRLADRLACVPAMTGRGTVHIHGFPFLTQAVTGHFPTVTMTIASIESPVRLSDVRVTFHDLRLPQLSGLTSPPSRGALRTGSIVITATAALARAGPLAQLARQPDSSQGLPPGRELDIPELPFPVRLDAIRRTPAGIRVTLSVASGEADTAFGRAPCQR